MAGAGTGRAKLGLQLPDQAIDERLVLRILMTVEQYWPSVGGMQEVVKQLSERLVRNGHEVVVATSSRADRSDRKPNGVVIEEFDIAGNAVEGYRWGDVHRYQEYLKDSKFDLMVNFAAQQWATDLALPLLDQISAAKIFVPTGFSGLYWARYQKYFAGLAAQMRQYDHTVFLSHDYRDIQFARENGITKYSVIPNAASEIDFADTDSKSLRSELGISDDSFLILTVGSHNGMKGHLEALEIFNRSRIKNATLLMVGDHVENGCGAKCTRAAKIAKWSPSLRPTGRTRSFFFQLIKDVANGGFLKRIFDRRQIIVRSLDRLATVRAFKAADLFLFCSAIECSPIVLFESAAAGTPFLTSEVGNAKEIIAWTGGGWLIPTRYTADRSFVNIASAVTRLEHLVGAPEELEAAGLNARQKWQESFTWAKICSQYEELFVKVVADHQGRTR